MHRRDTHVTRPRLLLLLAVVAAVISLGRHPVYAQSAPSIDDTVSTVSNAAESRLYNLALGRMYIAVDKPLYRPGETIWFRSFETDPRNPGNYSYEHEVTYELVDPRGSVVADKLVWGSGNLTANDFELDAGLVGGAYTIRATSALGLVATRPIIVSTYEPPRVKKTLEFLRKAYGPGDEVTATIELERATGEVLAGLSVTALVVLDDEEIVRETFVTNDEGIATLRFDLPASIARGDGLLTVLVDEGGNTESIQRRIPITMDRIDLAAYPEGGDLVVGLTSRVYYDARTPIGKPADIDAKVVDDTGKTVATTSTFHDGMGRFELTPEAGRSYEIVVTRPTSVTQTIALPDAREDGCTLRVIDDFESAETELPVDVQCTEERDVVLTAVLRGQLVHAVGRTAGPVARAMMLEPGDGSGAMRVTLFDRDGRPLAERLVYRGWRESGELQVTVEPAETSYSPRDEVELAITVTDPAGNPVQGEFAVAVVDDTVLNDADDKTAQILAAMLILPEMPGQQIEDPNFYFSDDPKAPRAMDLLMGTRGWRRFAWDW